MNELIQLEVVKKLTIDYESNWLNIFKVDAKILKDRLVELPYDDFCKTNYWRTLAKKFKEWGLCQKCCTTENLLVHHKNYYHHGEEHLHLEDLEVLCFSCHSREHNKIRRLQKKNSNEVSGYTQSLIRRNELAIK
jgi:5-methylcytosine-specific restriction endonuclease McrA